MLESPKVHIVEIGSRRLILGVFSYIIIYSKNMIILDRYRIYSNQFHFIHYRVTSAVLEGKQ